MGRGRALNSPCISQRNVRELSSMNHSLSAYLGSQALLPQPSGSEGQRLAGELNSLSGLHVYTSSIAAARGCVFFLGRHNDSKSVGVLASPTSGHGIKGETGSVRLGSNNAVLTLGATSSA